MTIYLDVVFIENIFMNAIILIATGIVTKTKCKIMKFWDGSKTSKIVQKDKKQMNKQKQVKQY